MTFNRYRPILTLPALICTVFAILIGGAAMLGYASGDPSGTWLAYTGNEIDGIGDIMLYDSASGRAHNLTRTPDENETRPIWSPDGRWLTFECDYPRGQRGFCLIAPTAHTHRRYRGAQGYRPAWSPDGEYMSWSESALGGYLLRAGNFFPSEHPTVGTGWTVGGIYSAMDYGWMPDNIGLVYSNYTDQASRVYLGGVGVALPRELPQPNSNNYEPTPSPDGRWIAFVTVVGYKRHIALLDLAANEYRIVTNGGGIGNDFSPIWSPDGTRLAYLSDRDGADFDIFILDMETRQERQATANYFLDDSITWSPDGTKIALMSNRDGAFHIYILNLIDGATTRVTTGGAANNFPAWRP